jgi:cytosol aminopeptidase family protein
VRVLGVLTVEPSFTGGLMKRIGVLVSVLGVFVGGLAVADDSKAPPAKVLEGTNGVEVIIRSQGPYDADVPLQIVCYFKHRKDGDKTLGAAVALNERLGGVIASLRNRGEFIGDESETLLITPPRGTIKPGLLLLVGLGDEKALSLETMERAGRAAQRQASRLGIKRVAFAPLLRDQGNSTLAVGDVESAVVRGVLLGYDTDRRLQREKLASEYKLEEWIVEAGPAFFDDTVAGVARGIAEAKKVAAQRPAAPYARKTE